MAELNVSVNPSGAVAGSAVANRSIASMGTTAAATQGQLAGLASQLFSLKGAMVVGAGAGTYALIQAMKSGVSEAAKFQTGLVGVSKTTGLVGKELDLLAKKISQTSKEIPVTTGELLELGQAAGQMGITGVENIEKFSITVAKLGRASDLAGAEAATALARILTVTGESTDQVDTLASVIVSLGNNVAATESEIAGMATRVSQSTSAFELGSTQATALSAALVALGVRAEAGGTSMGKVFTAMTNAVNGTREELEEFAGALDLDADKFQKLFNTDKIKGFEYFLEGVAAQGDSAGRALDEAGLAGERIVQAIVPLAKNIEVYTKTQKLANAEAKNATALNREFEATLGTLDSQWIITTNILADFSKELGSSVLPALTSALTAFNEWGAADGVSTMFDTLTVAGEVFATLLVARLVPAVVSLTAGYVANTTAAWNKQAATLAALQAQVSHTGAVAADTQAQVAAARAEVARATSMQTRMRLQAALFQIETRNTAATAAHTAALRAQAGAATLTGTAMRGLSGALALIGGPTGVALIAAYGIYRLATAESELDRVTRIAQASQEEFRTALKTGEQGLQDLALAAIKATEAELAFFEAQMQAAKFTVDMEGVGNPQTQLQKEAIEQAAKAIGATRRELGSLKAELKGVHADLDAFGGVGPRIAEAWNGVFSPPDNGGAGGGIVDKFQDFVDNFETDEQRLELFSQKLLFLNEKFNEGEISLTTYDSAVQALTNSVNDLIPKTEELTATDFGLGEALNTALGEMETALKESEKKAEQWQKIWDNAVDNMQREFGNTIHDALWNDGIKSFGDFADSLLDIWKRMISEMIAAWMVNGIAGLFSGQGMGGFSFGGFSIGGGGGGSGGGVGGAAINAGIGKAFQAAGSKFLPQVFGGTTSGAGQQVLAAAGKGGAETFALGAQGGQIAGVPLSFVSPQLAGTQAGAVQALTSNAAYTGGTAASGGGGGAAAAGSWGAMGLAIPYVAGQLIKASGIGPWGDTPEYMKALRDMKNSDAIGVQGGAVGQGERGGFFQGQNAGFVSQFAQGRGINTVGGGGRVGQDLADNYGAVSFQGMDLENVIQLLGEAQREFDAVQKSAVTAMKASGNEVNKIGDAMQNGIIEPVELASFGWIELGERVTNTKDGTARYTDLTVDSFNKINEAVNSGEIRMAALRQEVAFNQTELLALERIGVGAAGMLEQAFGSAEQRVYALGDGAARSFGVIGSAAVQAANDANAAFNSIRVPGGRSFGITSTQGGNSNSLPGLATGGSFMVGGEYGRDNNIVQFKASRGERVTVETPGQQRNGGANVQVNVYAPEGSSVERKERDGPDGRELDIIIDNAVANNLSRAGSRTANSLSRTYGSSRQLRRR